MFLKKEKPEMDDFARRRKLWFYKKEIKTVKKIFEEFSNILTNTLAKMS